MTTPSTDVSPGITGFFAFFALALVLYLLMRNMNARMRRMSYRQRDAQRGPDDPQADEGDGPIVHEPPSPVAEHQPGIDDPGAPGRPPKPS